MVFLTHFISYRTFSLYLFRFLCKSGKFLSGPRLEWPKCNRGAHCVAYRAGVCQETPNQPLTARSRPDHRPDHALAFARPLAGASLPPSPALRRTSGSRLPRGAKVNNLEPQRVSNTRFDTEVGGRGAAFSGSCFWRVGAGVRSRRVCVCVSAQLILQSACALGRPCLKT